LKNVDEAVLAHWNLLHNPLHSGAISKHEFCLLVTFGIMRINVSCTGVAQEVAAVVLWPECGSFLRHAHDIIGQIKKLQFCHVIKTILETIVRFKS
jgi:hypothetical protein